MLFTTFSGPKAYPKMIIYKHYCKKSGKKMHVYLQICTPELLPFRSSLPQHAYHSLYGTPVWRFSRIFPRLDRTHFLRSLNVAALLFRSSPPLVYHISYDTLASRMVDHTGSYDTGVRPSWTDMSFWHCRRLCTRYRTVFVRESWPDMSVV